MRIDCPSCGSQIEVGVGILEGENVRCPKCNHEFIQESSNRGDNKLGSAGWISEALSDAHRRFSHQIMDKAI